VESKIKKFPQYETNLYERKFTTKTNDAHHEAYEGRAEMPLRTSAVGITSTHRKSHQEATRGSKAIQSEPQEHHNSSDQNIMKQLNLIIGAIAISLLMLIGLLLVSANTLLKWLIYIPATLMVALAKLDLFISGIMKDIANLLNLQDHDQN
jgi:cation transport ATPase